MNSRNIVVVVTLSAVMIAIAIYMGNWLVEKNPDGLKLHSPTGEEAKEGSSAFGFGASIGLLATSLLYCVLAAGVLINSKVRRVSAGRLPLIIVIVAAVGFTTSYIVDGYFY